MNALALARTVSQVSSSMAIGDVACQILETSEDITKPDFDRINWNRTRTMFTCGLIVSGPWSHGQYSLLEYLFAGTTSKAVAKKVVFSALQAPISISLTFSTICLLQGKGIEGAKKKVLSDVPQTWLTGNIFWPAIMGINFKFVPLNHRPLVGSVAGAFWNIYIAYQANKVEGKGKIDPSAKTGESSTKIVLKRIASRFT